MRNHASAAALIGFCLAGIAAANPAVAAPANRIVFQDKDVFPESLTATAAGDILIGSFGNGAIYRARKGEHVAKVWISPQTSGMISVLGVLADESTGTLYACSTALTAPPETADKLSALRTFDLKTGAPKGNYPMPGGGRAICNDIAIGKDGAAYVSETRDGGIMRLARVSLT
jgi:hypothetical protein